MKRRLVSLVAALLATAAFAACSRAVSVGSTSAGVASYAVSVTNAGSIDLAVAYDDGSGSRALGLVRAGRSERFIIAAPRRTDVTITGATPDGTRVISSVPVQLEAGSTVSVTLR